jgi:hypothetical protein
MMEVRSSFNEMIWSQLRVNIVCTGG